MRLRCERVRRGRPQAIYLSAPTRLEIDQFPRTPLLLSSVNGRVASGVDTRKPKSTTTRRSGSLSRGLLPGLGATNVHRLVANTLHALACPTKPVIVSMC